MLCKYIYLFMYSFSSNHRIVSGEMQVVFWRNGSNVISMARNVFNSDGGRVTIGGAGNVYDLVINEVKLSDEGSYTCQIPGSDGAIQQKNMLTVNSE